jgi:hypothetical protein
LESLRATDTKPELADITGDVLEKHLAEIRKKRSAKTCNNIVKYLGAFFRDADEKHHTGDASPVSLPRRGRDRDNRRPLEL